MFKPKQTWLHAEDTVGKAGNLVLVGVSAAAIVYTPSLPSCLCPTWPQLLPLSPLNILLGPALQGVDKEIWVGAFQAAESAP